MSRYVYPYKSAVAIERRTFTVPADADGVHADVRGGRVVITLYRGMASDGWKTGYNARVVFWAEGESFRPNGKRFARECRRHAAAFEHVAEARARADFDGMTAHVVKLGAQPFACVPLGGAHA